MKYWNLDATLMKSPDHLIKSHASVQRASEWSHIDGQQPQICGGNLQNEK